MLGENQKDFCASREQYWAELPIEGKLERAREIVKRQGYEIDILKREIMSLSNKFAGHNHLNDNIVYREHISLDSFPGGIGRTVIQKPENLNEVYF